MGSYDLSAVLENGIALNANANAPAKNINRELYISKSFHRSEPITDVSI